MLAPDYKEVSRIEDAEHFSYLMICGHGYPSYLDRIKAAVEDLGGSRFNWLLVFVDAEDRSAKDRALEVEQVILEAGCPVPFAVFVADCCAESWLLGNRGAFARAERTPELKSHLDFYNVVVRDPEKMPAPEGGPTRASVQFDYLQALLRAMGRSYTKLRAGDTATPAWLGELRRRVETKERDGQHLQSFGAVLDFFDRLSPKPTAQEGSERAP